MYSTKFRNLQRFWVLAVIILLIGGCASTINYKDIQKDFTKAVESDNTQSYDPQMLGTLTTTYQQNYEDVIKRLNEPYIQAIDPRLKMNAYTMKAISQWRTGKVDEARQTVALALSQSNLTVGARDKTVLMILPALIDDKELTQKYILLPTSRQVSGTAEKDSLPRERQVSVDDYEKYYKKGYFKAVSSLKEAIKQLPPELPEEMIYYVHYQRWRILNNWNIVSTSLVASKQKDPDTQEVLDRKIRLNAYKDIKNLLGSSLEEEIQKEMDSVPKTSPLWNLMNYFKLPAAVPSGVKPPKTTELQPTGPKPSELKP
jgi:hypothetical protein